MAPRNIITISTMAAGIHPAIVQHTAEFSLLSQLVATYFQQLHAACTIRNAHYSSREQIIKAGDPQYHKNSGQYAYSAVFYL